MSVSISISEGGPKSLDIKLVVIDYYFEKKKEKGTTTTVFESAMKKEKNELRHTFSFGSKLNPLLPSFCCGLTKTRVEL
jgi:hypothetical protein